MAESGLSGLEAADERAEAGGESFVAVVGPDVLAESGQRGKAVGGQCPEERVELLPGRGVLHALLVDGGAVAEREAEGVVVDQGEGQGGLLLGQASGLQRSEERLGQGEGVRTEGVAGLEQPGDAGMSFQNRPQPARERLDLPGPVERAVGLSVDLGQHPVHDEVTKLFLAAHVPVQGPGDHSQAGSEAAHAQGVDAVGGDGREGLGNDPFAGQRTAALIAAGGTEPQRVRSRLRRWSRLVRHGRLRTFSLTVNTVYYKLTSLPWM